MPNLRAVGGDEKILVGHIALRGVGVEAFDQRPAFEDEMRDIRTVQDLMHVEQFGADARIARGIVGAGLGQVFSNVGRNRVERIGSPPGVVQQGRQRVPVGVVGDERPVNLAGGGEACGHLRRGRGEMQG